MEEITINGITGDNTWVTCQAILQQRYQSVERITDITRHGGGRYNQPGVYTVVFGCRALVITLT